MGLLKSKFICFLFLIFLSGCARSVIKLSNYEDENPYSQYGMTSQRKFYYQYPISKNLTEKWESGINGGFSNSSVVMYDSAVFINDLSGRIYCFSIINGKTLGQLKYKGSIFTTPILHNSILIFVISNDNVNTSTLVFYDFNLGQEVSSIEIYGRFTVEMLKVDDGIILISETGHVQKYDFSAKLIWDAETKSFVHSSPASDNKYLVFGNDDGEIVCIDSFDGTLVYRKKIGASFFCGTVISGNEIFIGNDNGKLYSIDLRSGNINWSFQTSGKIMMEAVVDTFNVVIGNLKGELFQIRKSDGEQMWKTETNGLLNSTPLLTPEYLILPDANKKLHLISADKGEMLDSILFDGRVKLSPVIKNNILFIGYENGNLKAYEFTR